MASSEKKRGRKSKVNAKHKIRLAGDDEVNEHFHKYVFKSVRSKPLQKLMLLWYVWMYNSDSEGAKELIRRYNHAEDHNDLPDDLGGLIHYLKPEDVMKTIGCNRRTAIEYTQVLQFIRPPLDFF